MFSLVDYQLSDDEGNNLENHSDDEKISKPLENKINNCNSDEKSIPKWKLNLNNLKNKLNKSNEEFYDENYFMNLESEYCSGSVRDSDFVKQTVKPAAKKSDTLLKFSEPKFSKPVVTIDFNDDSESWNVKGEIDSMNPNTVNLNLIKPEESEEISADFLKSGGLLTMSEQANLKRKYNIGAETIVAKKICMEDLTADRPFDMGPTLTPDDISRFKSLKEDQPDRNSSRQHQITWLAHKAKEKEFELMNSLAENTFSQNSSRNKYAF